MLQLQNKKSGKGPLWLVEKKYTLGKDASCDIKIMQDGIEAQHAEILVNGDDVQIVNLLGGTLIEVNGVAVTDKQALKAGDSLKVANETFEVIDPKATAAKKQPKPSTESGWALKALNTALAEKHFALKDAHVLGRSQECDISLGVVHLSRKHARVTVTDRGLKVEDLNSSNGTYVNGKKVSTAHAIAGDEISFDTLRFRVIGPVIDEDKTTMRPSSDGDLTTIRPALQMPPAGGAKKPAPSSAKPKSAKPAAAARSAASKPAAASTSAPNAASSSDQGGSNTAVIVIAAIVVIAGAAAAFFVMK